MTCDETYLTCQIHLHVVNLGTRVYDVYRSGKCFQELRRSHKGREIHGVPIT